MNTGFYIGIFAALFCGGMYLLYRNGMAVSKCIAAGLFVFLPGKNGYKASLGACTGWIRHTGRFRERRTYAFALDARLSRGDAAVILLAASAEAGPAASPGNRRAGWRKPVCSALGIPARHRNLRAALAVAAFFTGQPLARSFLSCYTGSILEKRMDAS